VDIATLIGLACGFGMILWAVAMEGSLELFFDLPSVVIVLGGTTAAILANFPLGRVRGLMAVLRKTVFHRQADPHDIIAKMVSCAERARKDGMLALEEDADRETDAFLRKGLDLAVDGTDPQLLEKIL
jgi:chemotaxis protein MotA